MGKGESSNALQNAQSHHSRPLAALKDPNAFGPPPKHVQTYGGATVPDTTMVYRSGPTLPIKYGQAGDQEERDMEGQATREVEATQERPPPSGPFRVDTTGLSTRNLPKPPARRIGTDSDSSPVKSPTSTKPKPSLPPRLPPRQNSATTSSDPLTPSSYTTKSVEAPLQKSYLNQGALSRLGNAGISIPGLGIGKEPESSQGTGMNELQGRFSKLSSSSTPPQSPSVGTSFAQKQAALKTVNSFRNNPSSVSLADAKDAASTANNFRERHGDQVTAGWQGANRLNTKYGIADRIGSPGPMGNITSPQEVPSPVASPIGQTPLALGGQKKAPPPPPPKKVQLGPGPAEAPPPIPLSSKPRP